MGNTSSSGYGHSFLDFFHSIGDFGKAMMGTFTGDTSGWGDWTNDMKNYGNDIAQTFTNNSYTRYGGGPGPDLSYATGSGRLRSSGGSTAGISSSTADGASQPPPSNIPPPAADGASRPPSAITSNPRSAVSAAYSSISSPPPSHIMAISDPNTKMAIASSRGSQRASVNLSNASTDLQSANAMSTASNAGGASSSSP